jgi:hypothetical protein
MTLDPISMLVGAVSAAVVAWWVTSDREGDDRGCGVSYGDGPTLHGKIIPGHVGSPSGPLVPRAGYASREDYEWGYVVGPGDSAEGIAQAIVGDDGRYQELLLANPQLKMIGEAGVYLGDRAWGVAPGQLAAGEMLLLPLPWSRYVDQLGHASGTTAPFSRDPRASTDVLVSGADDGHRSVPYDRPVALEAA